MKIHDYSGFLVGKPRRPSKTIAERYRRERTVTLPVPLHDALLAWGAKYHPQLNAKELARLALTELLHDVYCIQEDDGGPGEDATGV